MKLSRLFPLVAIFVLACSGESRDSAPAPGPAPTPAPAPSPAPSPSPSPSPSPAAVSINAANVLQTGINGGARLGINTNYWWDNQTNRISGAIPFAAAAGQIGKFWRYPGGEKADG